MGARRFPRSAPAVALAAVVLAGLAHPARADGLVVRGDQEPWPKLQTRVSVAVTTPLSAQWALSSAATGLQGGRILGDYYIGHPLAWSGAGLTGGFRATSGLLLASRGVSLSQPSVPHAGLALSVSQLGMTGTPNEPAADLSHGAAYVGVGYTGLSNKGRWGFTADVGLLAGNGLRVTRAAWDDPQRDFRVTPVLQLGVSYSF